MLKRRHRPTEADNISAADGPVSATTGALSVCTHAGLADIWQRAAGGGSDSEVAVEDLEELFEQITERVERRNERRFAIRLDACASVPGTDAMIDGTTINISETGLGLQMPASPPVSHLDILVCDATASSVVWGQVVESRPMPGGDVYFWHVVITVADDEWSRLLDRVSGVAQ